MQYHQIAVIGMSGRFAQSETLLDFRRVLSRKQDCIAEVSEKRKRLLGLEPDADCISWEASRTLTASTTSISAFRPKRRIL